MSSGATLQVKLPQSIMLCNFLFFLSLVLKEDDDLLQHAGRTYRTLARNYHFAGFYLENPILDKDAGSQQRVRRQNAEQQRRFIELAYEIVGDASAFAVDYRGILSSADAVILKGYARESANGKRPLDEMRDRFFAAVQQYPDDFFFAPGLDKEYIDPSFLLELQKLLLRGCWVH
jgi:hypothetical protein